MTPNTISRRSAIRTMAAVGGFVLAGGLWLPKAEAADKWRWGRMGVKSMVAPVSPPSDYLLSENFETATTGYENSWTEAGGTPNPVSTSPKIAGNQSLKLNGTAASCMTYWTASNLTTAYGYFLLQIEAIPSTNNKYCFTLQNGANVLASIAVTATVAALRATCTGGSGQASSLNMSINTTYQVWFECVIGSGTNTTLKVYANAIGNNKPALSCQSVNGTSTSAINRVYLYSQYSTNGVVMSFDKVRISSSDITGVPT